eukprot:6401309-Pyramimonas_sp.AAC.1
MVGVHAEADGAAAAAMATAFKARLRTLRAAVLLRRGSGVLLHTFAQGAVMHHFRAACSYNLGWTGAFGYAVF